jgi:SAM-dependent methyltransferase
MNEPIRLWDSPEAAAAWQRGASLRAASMRAPTDLMLDLAELQPGYRVLDVAAGSGEQTIAAAQRVGPTGSVLATDISGPMLELAAADATAAGIRHFETLVSNAEDLQLPPVSFDAAISRNGLMFVPDLRRALDAIYAALKPGRRLAAIVWSGRDTNPYTAIPQEIMQQIRPGLLDSTGMPKAFALAAPGALEAAVESAGFEDVTVRRVPIERRFPSAAALAHSMRTTFSPMSSVVQSLNADEQDRAWSAIERGFARFEGRDGCVVPGESLVGACRRPFTG